MPPGSFACRQSEISRRFTSGFDGYAVLIIAMMWIFSASFVVHAQQSPTPSQPVLAQTLSPTLSFEQTTDRSEAQFVARTRHGSLVLEKGAAVFTMGRKSGPASKTQTSPLRLEFSHSNHDSQISGDAELPGKVYHASGDFTGQLAPNATFGRVRYLQLYRGIDAVFYGSERDLEFDLLVAPHARPEQIGLSLSGADKITLDPSGNLLLRVGSEEVRLQKPVIYQLRDGIRTEVAGGYQLSRRASEVRFRLGGYDHSLPLIIDPAISFATYFGGAGDETISRVKVNAAGEIYLLGTTSQPDGLPTHQTVPIPVQGFSAECFLTKLAPDSSAVLYTVVFDGGFCGAMDLGSNGLVHLALSYSLRTLTESTMTLGLLQGAYDLGPADGSVSQLRADSNGNVYFITAYTPENNTSPSFIFELRKIDQTGNLIFRAQLIQELDLTNFGDQVSALDVDDQNRAYVVGTAASDGVITPSANAFQRVKSPNNRDGFLLEVNTGVADGSESPIEYATYLGGSQDEFLNAVLFDPATNTIMVSGFTYSPDFPTTAGSFAPSYTVFTGNTEAVVAKLDLSKPPAQQMVFGTYLGARSTSFTLNLLPGGFPVISGYTFDHPSSASDPVFPLVNSFYPPFSLNDDTRNYVSAFSPDGSSLLFSTYLTPVLNAEFNTPQIATNGSQILYVATDTNTQGLGVGGVFQPNNGGGYDLVLRAVNVADLVTGSGADVSVTATATPDPATVDTAMKYSVVVKNLGPKQASAVSLSLALSQTVTFEGENSLQGSFSCTPATGISTTAVACDLGTISAGGVVQLDISVTPQGEDAVTAIASVSSSTQDPNSSNNSATLTITVNHPSSQTTTSLVSSLNPSIVGQPVTFTASVTGVSPTGAVTFTDGGNPIGTPVALSGGSASFTTSALAAGSHSILASYGGDSNNLASTSLLQQTVNGLPGSSTTLTSSLNPSIVGQPVTFMANVFGVSPTGTVTFTDGGSPIGIPIALSGNTASLTTGSLIGGTHLIVANYSGDSNNLGSASPMLVQAVSNAVVSSISLTSSHNPSTTGQSVTFTATVTGLAPIGTVAFTDGGNSIGMPVALSGGFASLTTSALSLGSHNIAASYSGDLSNLASTSSILVQTVIVPYIIIDLGTLGGTESQGLAINNNGQVTGTSFISGGDILHQHAFLISAPYTNMIDLGTFGGGASSGRGINSIGEVTGSYDFGAFLISPPYSSVTDLGILNGTFAGGAVSVASGINDSGQVTGWAPIAGLNFFEDHAFFWDGTMHDLGSLASGAGNSYGHGINASGQVTGASDIGSEDHVFLYSPSNGAMTDLGTLGGNSGVGSSINASGQIAGYALTAAGEQHAFLWDGTMHDLGTLSGGQSVGFGINASGQIVGSSQRTGDFAHAFLYTSTSGLMDLNTLLPSGSGWQLLEADAINDAGQITGDGLNPNGIEHAFLLTPPPTPMGAIMSGTAVAKPPSGTANAVFMATFYNTSNQPVAVNFTSADGTALAGTDYVAASGTLMFAPGVTTQQVTVQILGGAPNSSNLSFSVSLTNATDSTLLATAVGTVLVPARPAQIAFTLAASPSSLSLGASSDQSSDITLQSSNGVSETAQLTAAWNGAAPSAGVTFTLFPSGVAIPPGASNAALTTLTVVASASPSAGTFDLRVTATSATGVTKSIDVLVTITPATLPPPGTCCTSAGPFVDPAPGVNIALTQAGASPSGKYQIVVSGGAPAGLANFTVNRGNQAILSGQAKFWGFSPDDDRFVTLAVQGSIQEVALYDLTRANPQAPIWTSNISTLSTRIQFSPSGRYLFYSAVVGGPQTQLMVIDAHTGTVEFTDSIPQAGGAPGDDAFGTIGWGFGPNDTRFVYGYLSGSNNVTWNLVNLEKGPGPNALVKSISLLNETNDYWKFSSCGEVIAIVRQPGQQFVYVDLYKTTDGTSAGSEVQIPAPVQFLQLHTTSTSHVVTNTTSAGSTDYTLGPVNVACTTTVSMHSPADILLVDPQGRRIGFDSGSGAVVNEIPGGSYTGVGTEPETITLPYAVGTYQVEAYGLPSLTAAAPYRLSIATADSTDSIDEHDIAGMASSRSLQQFVFTLDDHFSVSSLSPVDSTPPVITPIVIGTAGSSGWYASDVALSWNVADGESPIQSSSGCASQSVTIDTAGTTFTCTATSAGGTSSNSITVKRDIAPPKIACASPDGQWHASDVSIACTANDGGSGLANPATANFVLATTIPTGSETANASTGFLKVCDVAGNCANAGPISGNMVDKKAPAIALTTPANGAVYSANQTVAANYSCSDAGSGVASCAGTTASGAKIDTTPNGISTSKSFTVNSVDKAGNAASLVSNYVISCHYVAIGITPSSVKRPSIITVTADVMSCTSGSQSISVKFELTGPHGPNACGSTKTLMFTTPPFTIPKGTSKAISFPFIVPKTACAGTNSVISTTLINGIAVDVTEATLNVQ